MLLFPATVKKVISASLLEAAKCYVSKNDDYNLSSRKPPPVSYGAEI